MEDYTGVRTACLCCGHSDPGGQEFLGRVSESDRLAMHRPLSSCFGLVIVILCSRLPAQITDKHREHSSQELPLGEDPQNRLLLPFAKHLAQDQQEFWTAPSRLRIRDLKWIVPLAGVTTAIVASDSWVSRQVPSRQVANSRTISNYAAYS